MSEVREETKIFNPQFLTLFIANMIVSIGYSMVTTTLTLYIKSFGSTTTAAGFVAGILSLASLCTRPFTGWLSDTINRKHLMIASSVGIMVAMIGYGITQSIPMLSLVRVLHGICYAISTTTSLALVGSTLPKDRMGQGLGYFAAGQAVGVAFAPSLGIWLGKTVGYSSTFFLSGALVGLSALMICFLKTGAVPSSTAKTEFSFRNLLNNFFAKEAILYAVLAATLSGTKGIENNFIALYGEHLGLGNVGWYFTISAAMLLVSRLLFSKMGDRYSFSKVLGYGVGLMLIAYICLILAGAGATVVLLGTASLLKALGMGAVQPTVQANCLRSVPLERRGKASSTYYLGADIGQSLAPILGGAAIDHVGFSGMFALAPLPLLAVTAFYIIHSARRGQQ